jgi:hypothetical protein
MKESLPEVSSCPDLVYDPEKYDKKRYGWKDTEEENDEKKFDRIVYVDESVFIMWIGH